ncbi:hypothetical protein GIB67_017278 [Kingdonia uniflora]|uniref:Uncharacterized protein n=1 Tax=Kingdonia uniflora TaxID=39325 RepID=A0A7J7N3N2_9MAGN|nr:hypothetical protein GIB67_017278 [Kingdonia uniflora]
METLMIDCVQSSLRHLLHKNAIFMCERLCAEFPSELNMQLLASCYLHSNQAYCAYHILKGTRMTQSRYLFAMACFQMDLLGEAEAALCSTSDNSSEIPNGAAGHYLLGLIYRYTDRRRNAVDHFKQALLLDPLLWVAYEELCMLGVADEANLVFGEAAAISIQQQHMQHGSSSQNTQAAYDDHAAAFTARNLGSEDGNPKQLKHPNGNSLRDIPANHHGTATFGGAVNQPVPGGPPNLSLYSTPSPMPSQLSGLAPPPLCRNGQPNLNIIGIESSPRSTVNDTLQAPRRKFVDEGKLRKVSGRLFPDSGSRRDSGPRRSSRLAAEAANINPIATQVGGNGTNHFSAKYLERFSSSSKISAVISRSCKKQLMVTESFDEGKQTDVVDDARFDNTATTSSSISPLGDDISQEWENTNIKMISIVKNSSRFSTGVSELLDLLGTLGEGYRLSCMYRCQDALDVYNKLSQKQFNTGWVLSQILKQNATYSMQVGKANFELVNYFEANQAFVLARRVSPCGLEGMDIYSTVLYHLKEDMKLSYLAQELVSTDRLAPQSWCAIGNCYSLQKDHETALKNFQRAVNLNSRFAYAHTLCGHEHVALEDYENGIKCYQSALRIDSRHYNSWYGLGMVYLRQEKFEFSEHHFRKAFKINPRSSVIMCYLGIALHSLKRSEEALEMMEKANLADKKNPLPMYQKANILVNLERLDEALKELEELKELTPCESSLYALMGRIYKQRNEHDKAMFCYGTALDLKPSAADVATIKCLIGLNIRYSASRLNNESGFIESAIEKLLVPDELEDTL